MIITIPKPEDIKAAIPKASRMIKDGGGYFSGNEKSGHFGGRGVEGSYTVGSHSITVHINKKPFIFPDKAVKSYVQNFFKCA